MTSNIPAKRQLSPNDPITVTKNILVIGIFTRSAILYPPKEDNNDISELIFDPTTKANNADAIACNPNKLRAVFELVEAT